MNLDRITEILDELAGRRGARDRHAVRYGEFKSLVQSVAQLLADAKSIFRRVGNVEQTVNTLTGSDTSLQDQINANQQLATNAAAAALAANTAVDEILDLDTTRLNGTTFDQYINLTGQRLTTIEGNAAATFSMSLEQGNEAAGLQIVVSNDPNGTNTGFSALRFFADNILFKGSVSMDFLTVGIERNLIPDSDFKNGTIHWAIETPHPETSLAIRPAGQTFAYLNKPTLRLYQNGNTPHNITLMMRGADLNGNLGPGIPVTPGTWVEWSFRASTHRCGGEARIIWLDATGTEITRETVGLVAPEVPSSAINPGAWPQYGGIRQVPATAFYAIPVVFKTSTVSGQADSYLFINQPQFSRTHADAVDLSPYAPPGTTLISGGNLITGSITANHVLTSSFAVAGLAIFGGSLASSNYVATDPIAARVGWKIDNLGNAEFLNVTIRRQILFDTGTITETAAISGGGAGAGYQELKTYYVEATNVPISAWGGTYKTYIATAGYPSGQPSPLVQADAGDIPDVYWGYSVEVLPLTRWSGNQTLRLKITLWGKNVQTIQPQAGQSSYNIQWRIYEVS